MLIHKTHVAAIAVTFVAVFSVVAFNFDLTLLDQRSHTDAGAAALHHLALIIIASVAFVLAMVRSAQFNRLQAENLQAKENELIFHERAINEHAIVSATDPAGTIIDVNENFLKAFGYSRDQIIGKSHRVLYAKDREYLAFLKLRSNLFKGNICSGEYAFRTQAGEILQMNCTVVPLLDVRGKHIKNISIRTDVTAARRAEALEQIIKLFDGIADEVYIINSDTLKFIHANKAGRAWLSEHIGWADEEYIRHTIFDTRPTASFSEFLSNSRRLKDGSAKSCVYEISHETRALEVSLQYIKADMGMNAFICIVRDITARKEIEQAKREFVAVVSHELRSPLTAIKGALGLLKSDVAGTLPEASKPVVDIAYRNSERLLHTVNDMLDLEKIEAGRMDCTLTVIDLSAVVLEGLENNQGYGDELGVEFVGENLDEPVFINGNRDRLMQVVTNLMSNAAKFSPKGGEVRVFLTEQPECWRLSVSDDGPGIAESARKMIFEKFSQAPLVDGKNRGGTGLGLSIVKSILDCHDAHIDFTSKLGHGTTFFIDFPKVTELDAGNDIEGFVGESSDVTG